MLDRTDGSSLTVQAVADEAGQSLRTLYQCFASKDDLLLAVFEEAMRTYAGLVRAAIAGYDDPVERLAGALIASARVPAQHRRVGRDRALAQLRLQLVAAEPARIARAQEPLTTLYAELVAAIRPVAPVRVGVDAGAYLLASLRSSFTLATIRGDGAGHRLEAVDLSCFCLGGLGVVRPRAWHEAIEVQQELADTDRPSILRDLAG